MITCHPRPRADDDAAVLPGRRFARCRGAVLASGLETGFRCRRRANRRGGARGAAAGGGGLHKLRAGTPGSASAGSRLSRCWCRLARISPEACRCLAVGSIRCVPGRDGASPRCRPRGDGIPRRVLRLVRCCVFAGVVASVVFDPQAAFAASGQPFLAADSISTVISNMTAWLVGILAVVATFFLTLGGLRYLAAGGDPGEVEKAKAALRNAGIGYGLAVLAPVVVTVLKSLVGG